VELIPFDKLTSFFREHLTSAATPIAAANR
jgi:hypothetical protein